MPHEALREVPPGEKVGFNGKNMCCQRCLSWQHCWWWQKWPVSGSTGPHYSRDYPKTIQAKFLLVPPPSLGCHLAHSEFTEQKEKINGHSATKLEGGPTLWESGDAAILSMVPSKPTQAESISDYTVLDCCAVCDLRQRAAVSVIKAIERKLWPYVQTDNCCLPLRYKCYYCTLKDILLSWLLL